MDTIVCKIIIVFGRTQNLGRGGATLVIEEL
jgi:hypothetical protein